MDAIKAPSSFDNRHTCYKVVSSNHSSSEALASIIADAILREPYAVPLAARFDGDYLEMEKIGELMSEFEKDELVIKTILRSL